MRIARTQPPVGYRIRASELVRAALPLGDSHEALTRDVRRNFGVQHAYGVSSGKAALAVTLSALHSLTGRRKVILPAYTCYSVPSAIVKAGLEPVPCDLAPGSFDYDYAELQALLGPDVLCALSVHLFGIPADARRLAALCRPHGVFVVEDAAQALEVAAGERTLGTDGDAAIFSFGRGKNVTCGSGGLIVTGSDVIGGAVREIVERLPRQEVGDGFAAFAGMAMLSLFISPHLYWLPAGLPFLKLGETIFHEDFPVRRLSGYQARLLRGWRGRLVQLNGARRQAAAYYLRHVFAARDYGHAIPYLRFPVLVDPKARRLLVTDDKARRLGISGMYPGTVGRIPQLEHRLSRYTFPRADDLATRLVTLPTHPLLTREDLARVSNFVNHVQARSVRRPSAGQSPSNALAPVHH